EVFEEWFNIIDNTVVANEEAKQQISTNQNIQEFVTEKGLEEMIIPYLSVYLRDTDRWGIITEEDIGVRFQVLEQTEKSFKASTIRLATFAEYDPSETVVLDYVQEDGNWKFNGFEKITTEEEPLNLTSEDLKYAFTDPETGKVIEGELVEETVIDGEDYIVMKYDDYYEARNVKDSSLIFYEEHDESESLGAEGDAEEAAAEEKQTSGKETESGHTDNKENNDQQ